MTAFNNLPQGKLEIGLNTVQESEWLKAIKEYGPAIMECSRLSKWQKGVLVAIASNIK